MDQKTFTSSSSPGESAANLKLFVLGGLALRDNDGQPVEIKARKNRILLAYLAVSPEQVRSRDQLANLLWSDRQDEQARSSLRTALSGIRKALGKDALMVDQDTVQLTPGYLTSDYDELKRTLDEGRSVSGLGEFYGGEFLAAVQDGGEEFLTWQRDLRAECGDLAIRVLERNAEMSEQQGDHQKAIDLLRESLSLEPLKEQTHRNIMRLHAANGERAMAMAQFRTCKDVLIHELNTGPDPETQALADSIALRDTSVSDDLRRPAASVNESPSSARTTKNAPTAEEISHDARPSIAVLPFVNMSADAEQDYFADGITEDISIDLSVYEALSVAPKSSGELYRGSQVPVTQVARELDVEYLLQGSVRKAGDNVRISAILIDAGNNRQVWAERFDRTLDDIFELQSEIAKAIVDALKVNLNLEDTNVPAHKITFSGEAYQIYLRGISFREVRVRVDNEKAKLLFERALELDPEFAHAHAALAECRASLAQQNELSGEAFDAEIKLAVQGCRKALEIAPDLAEAHLAMGHILAEQKQYDEAKEYYMRSIALNPSYGAAHFCLANHYLAIERDDELAYENFKKSFAINPDNRTCMMLMTTAVLVKSPELKTYAEKIVDLAQRSIKSNPHDFDAAGNLSCAHYHLGNLEEARYWANITSAFEVDDRFFYYNNACILSMVGEIDRALETLERALAYKDPFDEPDFVRRVDPDFENLRKDPRFYELVDKYYP